MHGHCAARVFKTLTFGSLWAVPRHASPMVTHPRSSHCAEGALQEPLICSFTLSTHRISLPKSRRKEHLALWGGILSATCCKCRWCCAITREWLSFLSSGITSRSIKFGSEAWFYHPDPLARFLPIIFITPEQVLSVHWKGQKHWFSRDLLLSLLPLFPLSWNVGFIHYHQLCAFAWNWILYIIIFG